MNNVRIPLSEKRLLTIPEFQAYASIGRNNAFKLIRLTGSEIRIGKRVYADRVKFDAWCSEQTS
jgi:hypothetical protein